MQGHVVCHGRNVFTCMCLLHWYEPCESWSCSETGGMAVEQCIATYIRLWWYPCKSYSLLEISGGKWNNFYLCGWIWSCNFNYFFTARFAQDAEVTEVLFHLPLTRHKDWRAGRAANENHPALRAHQELLQQSCWAVPLCRPLNGKGEIIYLCALCVFAVNTRFSWNSKTET